MWASQHVKSSVVWTPKPQVFNHLPWDCLVIIQEINTIQTSQTFPMKKMTEKIETKQPPENSKDSKSKWSLQELKLEKWSIQRRKHKKFL